MNFGVVQQPTPAMVAAALRAMETALELKPDDSVLVYYAGHGWLDPESGRGYWVPVDAAGDDERAADLRVRLEHDPPDRRSPDGVQ